MPVVAMPDGTQVAFPDDMQPDQIRGMITTKFPDASKQSFLDRVGGDLSKRSAMGDTIAQAYNQGQQGVGESIAQTAGKVVAGTGNDIIGEGLKSAGSFLGGRLSAMTPDAFKPAIGARDLYAKSVADFVMNSDIGKAGITAAKQGVDYYKQFAAQNPRAARDLESAVDIGTLLPLGKGAGVASEATGGALSGVGGAIANSADARALANKSGFVQDLITPKVTPTVRADQFSRSTEQGLLRNRVVEPTPQETAMIGTVSQLPVSKSNSLLKNYNIISDANQQEASSLIDRLKQNDVAISPDITHAALDSSLEQLKQNPFITGDAETAANRVITGMKNVLSKNDATASGLLQARKDFDSWVRSQKGSGIFDPTRENAVTTAVQNVRQTINNLVDSAVPDAGVKDSLAKQSNLYRVMDNIETKGGLEAPNAIKRLAEKAGALVPGKTLATKAAIAAGLSGGAYLAPAAAAGVGLAYGAKKVLGSPALQKGIGATLDTVGQLMQGKNPLSMIMKMPPAQAREALNKLKASKP